MPPGRPKTKGITPRQAEILQELIFCKKMCGRPPTMRQLAKRMNISAPTMCEFFKGLIEKGYIRKEEEQCGRRTTFIIIKTVTRKERALKPILLLDGIPCGPPSEPITGAEGKTIMVDAVYARDNRFFALRLDQDRMRKIGYNTGGAVIVRRQQLAENGDIVAAVLNGKAMLKRLIFEKDRIALKADDSDSAPTEVACEDEFKIIGKVVCHIKERNIVYGKQQSSKIHQPGLPSYS